MASNRQFPPTQRVSTEYLTRILESAQERTLSLVNDLTAEQKHGVQAPGLNPLWWEIGHIAWFHEKFILRDLDGERPCFKHADGYFDSFQVGHEARWRLASADLSTPLDYLDRVRKALIDRLSGGLASEADSYFYQLTTFHEDMHHEAFIYTRQRLGYPRPSFVADPPGHLENAGPLPGDVAIPGGLHWQGSDEHVPFSFDNERQMHPMEVGPFQMARAPVTNEAFAAFIADGGYERREFWSEEGWQWRCSNEVQAPAYWQSDGQGGWRVARFDEIVALRPYEPVVHVSWFEANAYCSWAGRRLPTEHEWEVAASRRLSDSGEGLSEGKRLYPWGDDAPAGEVANLDAGIYGPVDVAAFSKGENAFGCRQLLGNVWEWTASSFRPYPGFEPDPYREYSEPWFEKGDNKVLRGGAWATRSRLINSNHRNFFTPERRDIYAGFRTCA